MTGEWQFHYGVAMVEATFTDIQSRTHRAHDYARVFGPTEQDEIHNESKRDGSNNSYLSGYISKANRAGSVMGQLPSLLALQNISGFIPGVVDPKTEKAILMLNQYTSAWASQITAFNQRMQKTISDVHSENMKMIQDLPEAGVAGSPEQLS